MTANQIEGTLLFGNNVNSLSKSAIIYVSFVIINVTKNANLGVGGPSEVHFIVLCLCLAGHATDFSFEYVQPLPTHSPL